MSAEPKTAEVVEIQGRQEAQAAQRLEKIINEFMGGLPYDRDRIIERGQDGFEEGVRGFFKGGMALLILEKYEDGAALRRILNDKFPGISRSSANRYIKVARAMAEFPNFGDFVRERGGYSKGLTLLESCTPEELAEFEENGNILDYAPDQVDKMSHRQLKKAILRAREKAEADKRKATAHLSKEIAELREENLDLKAQVGAGETEADKAIKRIQGANDKILAGLGLLNKVERSLLVESAIIRDAIYGVIGLTYRALGNLETAVDTAIAEEAAREGEE
jgi:hypothetical protein